MIGGPGAGTRDMNTAAAEIASLRRARKIQFKTVRHFLRLAVSAETPTMALELLALAEAARQNCRSYRARILELS